MRKNVRTLVYRTELQSKRYRLGITPDEDLIELAGAWWIAVKGFATVQRDHV
jgi:hypothetical protein